MTSTGTDRRAKLGLTIHGFDESLYLVRSLVDEMAHAWGLPSDVAYVVKVCANEFATNAIAATPGEKIEVCLTRDAGGVLIEVWDSAGVRPRMQVPVEAIPGGETVGKPDQADSLSESGRGLFLVETLATKAGFRWLPPPGCGKIVWAYVAVEEP